MGDAAGQSSNRLHLLRLTQLLFQVFALGDVASDALDSHQLSSGIVHEHDALFNPDGRTVLVHPT